jgi:chromate transporter
MQNSSTQITFKEFLLAAIKVALYSFGGPAGQIAVMHKIFIEEKKWLSEDRFLHALNYCMLLPGPEAQQLSTYIGWLLYRFKGGIIAGTIFVLPGFISILILSILYALYQDTHFISALFFGLKAAVLAIVINAIFKIGKKALKNSVMYLIAFLSFIAIFFFNIPFPLIIISAGLIGLIGGLYFEKHFYIIKSGPPETENDNLLDNNSPPTLLYILKVFLIFGTLWILPLLIIAITTNTNNPFFEIGFFFSKAALVSFGGAYALLAYISQEAVITYGWLKPGEMLDGLGMAETTPGPLIQVVQFVGFLGAFRLVGDIPPLYAGILASLLVTWVTFIPSFLWIFMGAPFIEKLRNVKQLNTALSAITAAVVGVILNLAIWFFLHTVFSQVAVKHHGPLRLYIPDFSTIDLASLFIALLSFILLFRYKLNLFLILLISIILGISVYLLR